MPAPRLATVTPPQLTVLLGAGASVESGAPTAIDLTAAIFAVLVADARAREELLDAARGRTTAPGRPPHLRFEQVLTWVAEVFDPGLGLLAFLDLLTVPSRIHRASAQAGAAGAVLLTVNFDDLLEQAVIQVTDREVATIDAHRGRSSTAGGAVPVVKLHGSRRWHPLRVADAPGFVHGTVEQVAAANPGLTLNEGAAHVLRAAIEGRVLVVVGYSGSDDLDIVPGLMGCAPARAVWLDWAPRPPERLRRDRWSVELGPTQAALLDGWSSAGTTVEVVQGDSAAALEHLGLTVPDAARAQPVDWRAELERWAVCVRWNDPTGLGFAGLVMGDIEQGDASLRMLTASRPATRSGATWTPPRRLYELAQAHLLRTPSDPGRAYQIAGQSVEAARRAADVESVVYGEMLQGRAALLYRPAGFAAAIEHLEAALAAADPGSVAWAYASERLANVLARAGHERRALRLVERANRILEREGLVSDLLDGLVAEGVAAGQLGRWQRADTALTRAGEIAQRLGYAERLFDVLQIRGSHAFDSGRLPAAEELLGRAAELLDDAGHDEESALWGVVGALRREQGRHRAAARAFRSALSTMSEVTDHETAALWADLAEAQLLAGWARAAMRSAAEAERHSAAGVGWWATAHAALVRLSAAPSAADRHAAADALRVRPQPADRSVLVQAGMSAVRLRADVPGVRRLLYRAERAARTLGATERERSLRRARLGLGGPRSERLRPRS